MAKDRERLRTLAEGYFLQRKDTSQNRIEYVGAAIAVAVVAVEVEYNTVVSGSCCGSITSNSILAIAVGVVGALLVVVCCFFFILPLLLLSLS